MIGTSTMKELSDDFRGVFRNLSNIYDETKTIVFSNIVND